MESLTCSPGRYAADSIFGSLEAPINTANNSSEAPITMYGSFTDAACCTRYACRACGVSFRRLSNASGAPLRIISPPSLGATVVPRELNACVRSNRLDAVSGFPNTTT